MRAWEPTTEDFSLIRRLAGLGLGIEAIAIRFGYSKTQFNAYIKTDPRIAAAMAQGRSRRQEEVAEAIIDRIDEGDFQAMKYWEQSRYGTPSETIRLQGDSENPLAVKTEPDADLISRVLLKIEEAHVLRGADDT